MAENISHLKFSPNNRFLSITSGRRVSLFACPSPSTKGRLLEPFLLIRRFNTESTHVVTHFNFSDDSRFMIYSSDDHVLRTVGTLGGDFPRAKLRGHKSHILGSVSYLDINKRLLSIDRAGLVFLWELVQSESEGKGFKTLTGKNINRKMEKKSISGIRLSPLEEAFQNSRFILKTKLLLFQENTQIDQLAFSNDKEHLTVAFKNHSFGVYRINSFSPDNLVQNLMTFRKDESFGKVLSLIMHPTKPLISFGDSKKSLVVWDWKAKNYLLKQRALSGVVTAVAFSQENRYLAVGDAFGFLKVFDFRSLLNTVTFEDANGKISAVR